MNISRMFHACKVGDIETVKSMVEIKEVDVNFRDKFDSTPLYYACLCGHIDVVRFLLEHGAKCDVKTFDGERCVYGALTDDIRRILLKEYKIISKRVIRRNDYDEFLRKSIEEQNDEENYFDVMFNVNKTKFKAHRCILMVRCRYFKRMFTTKWRDRNMIQINNDLVVPEAFKVLLHFIYTGILEFSLNHFEAVSRLFKHCEMFDVYNLIQSVDTMKTKSRHMNLTVFIECPIKEDFQQLFLSTQPLEMFPENQENCNLTMFDGASPPCDVMFKVDHAIFRCHRLFFARRSEYFAAIFKDHFNESIKIDGEHIPVFELQNDVQLFNLMLTFLYTNTVQLNLDQACELLYISDRYLIESLKRYCAQIIGNNISQFNSVDVIQLARTFHLPKLETIAVQHIAENLKQYLNQEDFQRLVVSDAQAITQRQETDSIDIIDDIRYYLTIKSKKNIHHDLIQIDALLESLELEA